MDDLYYKILNYAKEKKSNPDLKARQEGYDFSVGDLINELGPIPKDSIVSKLDDLRDNGSLELLDFFGGDRGLGGPSFGKITSQGINEIEDR